jgi:glycosyl transferase family 25
MKSFVISLERTPHRLEHFYSVNRKHQHRIEHFHAVDGSLLDREALIRQGVLADMAPRYSNAFLGSAMSHRHLWERAIALDEPITVFEDDAILHDRFFEKTEQICALAQQWDFMMWGWNFDSFLTFMLPGDVSICVTQYSQDQMRENIAQFQQIEMEHPMYRLLAAFGLPAYSVSPSGAKKLLERCFPPRDTTVYMWGLNTHFPNNGIDVAANAVFRHSDFNATVSFPPLAVTPNDHGISTIVGKP